jgi:hypothetical protein
MGRDRTIIDDPPPLRFLITHHAISTIGNKECACRVHVQNASELLQLQIPEIDGQECIAGIVEENVKPAMFVSQLGKQLVNGYYIGHICGKSVETFSGNARSLIQTFLAAGCSDNSVTRLDQGNGSIAPYTRTCPSYKRNSAHQVFPVIRLRSLSEMKPYRHNRAIQALFFNDGF